MKPNEEIIDDIAKDMAKFMTFAFTAGLFVGFLGGALLWKFAL